MWEEDWFISQYFKTNTGSNKYYLRLYTKESADYEELQILPDTEITDLDVHPDYYKMLQFYDLIINFSNDRKIGTSLSGSIPCDATEKEYDKEGYEYESTPLRLCSTLNPIDNVIDNNPEAINFINNMLAQNGLTQINLVKNPKLRLYKPNTFVANCNIMNSSHYIKKTIKQQDNRYVSSNEKLTADELKPLYDFFISLQKKQSLMETNTLEIIHKNVEKEPSTSNSKDKYLGNRDLIQYTKKFVSKAGKKTKRRQKKRGKTRRQKKRGKTRRQYL
jgi:hypothetical protein